MGFGLKDKASLAYQKDESKSFRYKENALVLGLVGMTVLFGIFLTLPGASAETDAVDRITITVPPSCSLSTSVDNPTHTATIRNHQYVDDIGETTIKAVCNDVNGFSVYAIGFSDGTDGKTVLSASTVDHANDIVTGTATGPVGGNDVSNWAMRLSPVAGTYAPTIENGFDEYSEVPATYTKVATFTSRTDQSLGSSLRTNYAVYVSGSQLADTYTGKVKYTMVHPHTEPAPFVAKEESTDPGRICYYPNFGAKAENGTMGCQTVSTSATSATLLASNFSRDGYGFAGWSNKYDYATNPTQDGIKFYGPNETITFTAGQYTGSNKGLSLYAVWVKSQGNLQDADKVTSVCSGLTAGATNLTSVSALTDQRDNNTYAIAKLADGNCWMIENLRLESTNSDNSTGSLAQGYNSSFIGLATAESEHFSSSDTTANSLYTTESNIDGKNTISGDYQAYRFPRYNNTNTSTRASSPTTNSDVNMYSYGNYYTWHAAIADTTHNGTNNNSSDTTSICPKGWRLPHGGQTTVNTTAEFYLLGKAIMKDNQGNSIEPDQNASGGYGYYGNSVTNSANKTATNAFRSYPNNFLYSGNFRTSSAYNRGSEGYYWSSTAYDLNYSYYLTLYSSSVNPGTLDNFKSRGYSIRCLAV